MKPVNYQPSRLVEALTLAKNMPRPPVLSPRQSEVIGRIIACGSGRLGASVQQCRDCGHSHVVAHSCRDRHCPRCQRREAEAWLERQKAVLLPVPYFHLVFTIPHELNPVIRQNRRVCLNLFFKTVCSTLIDFGHNNLGAQIGLTAVLHTWGQTLCEHYHLHVIVTGGGLSAAGDEWVEAESGKWLFSTRALAQVYQARYLEGLQKLYKENQLEFHGAISHWSTPERFRARLRQGARRKWHVYAKAPFAGPEQVLEYLALYSHRVAVSQRRIKQVDHQAGTVRFRYKDYADNSKWKSMTLDVAEFTRRFAQHILPPRFCKIRHCGILSNRNRQHKVALSRIYLQGASPWSEAHEDTAEMFAEAGLDGAAADQAGGSDGGAAKCERCGSTRLHWIGAVPVATTGQALAILNRPTPVLTVTRVRGPTL